MGMIGSPQIQIRVRHSIRKGAVDMGIDCRNAIRNLLKQRIEGNTLLEWGSSTVIVPIRRANVHICLTPGTLDSAMKSITGEACRLRLLIGGHTTAVILQENNVITTCDL